MKYLALESQQNQHFGYQQLIKEQNIKRAFDLVRNGKCASRAELSRTMQLSATTISALVEELQQRGLVLEGGLSYTSFPGRRPMKLQLNQSGRQLAVFSLNRSGVRFSLLDLNCRILESLFVPHPVGDREHDGAHEDYAQIFEDILLKKSQKFEQKNTIVIGVSFPGIYIEEEQAFSVRTSMNISFSEASMRAFEQRMGIPLLLANASMCLAYAEKKLIDAHSSQNDEIRDLIFVNICDGVGAGIISEGSVLTGPFNTAGELGHISVDLHGKHCPCGGRGCLEQYVNQNAILESVAQACRESREDVPVSLADLEGIYERSDAARGILNDIAEKLAFGVFTLICVTGIRRIVLGGSVDVLGPGFLRTVNENVCRCYSLTNHLEMAYAKTGLEGESIGLAHYFLDKGYSISLNETV